MMSTRGAQETPSISRLSSEDVEWMVAAHSPHIFPTIYFTVWERTWFLARAKAMARAEVGPSDLLLLPAEKSSPDQRDLASRSALSENPSPYRKAKTRKANGQ